MEGARFSAYARLLLENAAVRWEGKRNSEGIGGDRSGGRVIVAVTLPFKSA